jgi:hypothetical protein
MAEPFFIKRKNSDKFTNFKTPYFLFISARVQQRHSTNHALFSEIPTTRERSAADKRLKFARRRPPLAAQFPPA